MAEGAIMHSFDYSEAVDVRIVKTMGRHLVSLLYKRMCVTFVLKKLRTTMWCVSEWCNIPTQSGGHDWTSMGHGAPGRVFGAGPLNLQGKKLLPRQ